jgi:hypothetical protein
MKQIPPCSLRSLVGMTRIIGCARSLELQGLWLCRFSAMTRVLCLCAGVVRGSVRGGDEADSSLLATLARRNDKDFALRSLVGMTKILGDGRRNDKDCDGVKPFSGLDRLNRVGV